MAIIFLGLGYLTPSTCLQISFFLKVERNSSLAIGELRGGTSHFLAIVRSAAMEMDEQLCLEQDVEPCGRMPWKDVAGSQGFSLSEKRHTDFHVPAVPVCISANRE